MAWRKRFRGYARSAMRGRRYSRRGFGAAINLPLVAGVAAGWLAPRVVPYQDLALTTIAVLPIKLPYNMKYAAQGYVLGMIAKGFMGGGPGTITQSDFV